MTVSRDGTDSIEPSIALARAMKTLPYSQGWSEGRAIAGWVENLCECEREARPRIRVTHLAAIPAILFSKKLEPVLACTLASRSRRSIQGN